MQRSVAVRILLACSMVLSLTSCDSSDYKKNGDVSVIGDSISHGAFSIDSRKNLWLRVYQSEIAPMTNYGFSPIRSVGSGEKLTTGIARVRMIGEWEVLAPDAKESSESPSGYSMKSLGKNSGISIVIPSDQAFTKINWIQNTDGGTMRVYADGKPLGDIETAGELSWKSKAFSLGAPAGPTRTIYLQAVDENPVYVVGAGYYKEEARKSFNNYSHSGRTLESVSRETISKVMTGSSVLFMALGHNDQRKADSDDAYFSRFRDRIDWIIEDAKSMGVRVVVPDFCWTVPENSRTRSELRRLAYETKGVYINLPSKLSSDGEPVTADRLINDLGMWWDPSHPNISGHRWIADQISDTLKKEISGS